MLLLLLTQEDRLRKTQDLECQLLDENLLFLEMKEVLEEDLMKPDDLEVDQELDTIEVTIGQLEEISMIDLVQVLIDLIQVMIEEIKKEMVILEAKKETFEQVKIEIYIQEEVPMIETHTLDRMNEIPTVEDMKEIHIEQEVMIETLEILEDLMTEEDLLITMNEIMTEEDMIDQ